LADDTIDLVDICLPTPMHRDVTIAALRAGKHVLVEKPIALTLKDADAMINAARESNRLLMVAHVLRFVPAFAEAREIVFSEKYGALLDVHLKRIIGRRAPEAEAEYFTEAGGPVIDLHIHDTDYIHHLCGIPSSVRVSGYVAPNGNLLHLNSQYIFEGRGFSATSQCGALGQPPVTFEHGFDIYLENATLRYNNLSTGDAILLCAKGKRKEIAPRRKEAFAAQLQHAIECVRDGRESDIISAGNARAALAVCLLEKQSALTGKAQKVKA
jgi:predicted dehydrogenase